MPLLQATLPGARHSLHLTMHQCSSRCSRMVCTSSSSTSSSLRSKMPHPSQALPMGQLLRPSSSLSQLQCLTLAVLRVSGYRLSDWLLQAMVRDSSSTVTTAVRRSPTCGSMISHQHRYTSAMLAAVSHAEQAALLRTASLRPSPFCLKVASFPLASLIAVCKVSLQRKQADSA